MSLASTPLATLRGLLDRLIPADDYPGAIGAGVEKYVGGQLAGDCVGEADAIAGGLAQLELEAAARYAGAGFAALTAAQQDALLSELEAGRPVTVWPAEISAAVFFNRMVDLAHEGFYADPGNGGNRDAVSWKMIGYAPRLPETPPSSSS